MKILFLFLAVAFLSFPSAHAQTLTRLESTAIEPAAAKSLSIFVGLVNSKNFKQMGFESFANAPRVIDIDILFYEDRIMNTQTLTIPHPHLEDRAFVLIPLVEVAPDLIHPKLGRRIAQLAKDVEGQKGVRKYKGGFHVSATCRRAL